jgi:hypothetical protein
VDPDTGRPIIPDDGGPADESVDPLQDGGENDFTTACIRYGCHENPTTGRCNRCASPMR